MENVLWSFATLGYIPPHSLLSAATDFLQRNLLQYNQQNLALTLWAYARLGFEVCLPPGNPDLHQEQGRFGTAIVRLLCPRAASSRTWDPALSNIGSKSYGCSTSFPNCSGSEASDGSLSLRYSLRSAVQVPAPALKEAAEQATRTMADSNPQNLANILWAFATMEVLPPDSLLTSAVTHFLALLPQYNSQGLTNTLWALATLGYFPGTAPLATHSPCPVQHVAHENVSE